MNLLSVICLLTLSLLCVLTFAHCDDSSSAAATPSSSQSLDNLLVIVLSQPSKFHESRRKAISNTYGKEVDVLYVGSDYASDSLSHRLFPLFPSLVSNLSLSGKHSFLFVLDSTLVWPSKLAPAMEAINHTTSLAYITHDEQHATWHHYDAPDTVNYPVLAGGWLMSRAYLTSLATLTIKQCEAKGRGMQIFLDPIYEVARCAYNNLNLSVVSAEQFCLYNIDTRVNATQFLKDLPTKCATIPLRGRITNKPVKTIYHQWKTVIKPNRTVEVAPQLSTTHDVLYDDNLTPFNLVIAVKTAEKFHKDRLQKARWTWEPELKKMLNQTRDKFKHYYFGSQYDLRYHVHYYSHTVDRSIPTLDVGVPNSDKGHAAKLRAILFKLYDIYVTKKERCSPEENNFDPARLENIKKHMNRHRVCKQWFYICDDDTIFGLYRLLDFLKLRRKVEEPTIFGEKYALHAVDGKGEYQLSYYYPTGGGGMLLNRAAVRTIVEHIRQHNIEAAVAAPDDMWLGGMLRSTTPPIDFVHTREFHQIPNHQYPPSFLYPHDHVSFHKHQPDNPNPLWTYFTQLRSKYSRAGIFNGDVNAQAEHDQWKLIAAQEKLDQSESPSKPEQLRQNNMKLKDEL